MELICPSCEARYQLPDGSISARGRQVSCMNCGHSWHAYPPMALGDPAVGGQGKQPSDPQGIKYEPPAGAPRPGERRVQQAPYAELGSDTPPPPASAEPPRPGPVEAGGTSGEMRAENSRTEQMAEIRQMLAEVQSEERARAALRPEADRTVVAPAAAPAATATAASAEAEAEQARVRLEAERAAAERAARRAAASEAEANAAERDFKRRAEQASKRAKTKPTDVKKLRRKHERKINKDKHASKAGSGAFLTGFLLIAVIAATMVSLYVLSPQIVARMPGAEEPMREYVATMDKLRAGASETIANVQKWVQEQMGDEKG